MEKLRYMFQTSEELFWLKDILKDRNIMVWVMAFLVFLLTQLIKTYGIKKFTNKLENEKIKTLVNSTIILLSLILGCAFEWFYTCYMFNGQFNLTSGLMLGGQSSLFYGILERVLKYLGITSIKVENPFDTEDGKELLEEVGRVSNDGVVTKEETQTLISKIFKKANKKNTSEKVKDEQPEEIKEFVNNIGLK